MADKDATGTQYKDNMSLWAQALLQAVITAQQTTRSPEQQRKMKITVQYHIQGQDRVAHSWFRRHKWHVFL